jgi:hypothetical protein
MECVTNKFRHSWVFPQASSTVFSIMKKWRQTETVERLPGSGGHLVSTPNDDEALLNIVQNSPFTDAVAAVNITNFPGSVWTTRRRIKANNLRNYKAAKKIRLTPRHMEARIGFSLQHLVKHDDFWSRVIFSDEKVFQSSPNGQLRVYRRRNTRYDEQYIQKTERSGRFSVNMWAWIFAVSPGVMLHVEPRLNADVYIMILEDVMLRFVRSFSQWRVYFPTGQLSYPYCTQGGGIVRGS